MQSASSTSKVFLAVIVLSGLAVLANAVLHVNSANPIRFVSFLLVACMAARLKVRMPGLTGNMSVNLPFILVAAAALTASEALAIACLSTLVQCLPSGAQKFNLPPVIFNFCNMALAVGASRFVLRLPSVNALVDSYELMLVLSAAAYFIVNTASVAIIISLTEAKNALKVWGNILQLSFPYFVLSAAVAALVLAVWKDVGWQLPLLVLPLMFGVFKSYKRYFGSEFATVPQHLARGAAAS